MANDSDPENGRGSVSGLRSQGESDCSSAAMKAVTRPGQGARGWEPLPRNCHLPSPLGAGALKLEKRKD